jgi:hypothetical protein
MDYYYNIIESILIFISIFLILTLSLNFWGYFILKILKINYLFKIGHPTTLTAGLALICLIGWSTNVFIQNYYYLLSLFIYIGVLGYVFWVLIWLKLLLNSKNKYFFIKQTAVKYKYFGFSLLTASIFSFFYSAIWPSGQMEFWMFSSSDYFNWALICDFWLGRVNPEIIQLTNQNIRQLYDSFGTSTIFGLYSIVSGKSALWCLVGFMVTLAVWTTTAIMILARRLFCSSPLFCWLLAICVTGGPFFNYLIFMGQVGQLLATIGFITCLIHIFSFSKNNNFLNIKKIVIPIFLIFISYQGGFFAFFVVLFFAAFVFLFFQNKSSIFRIKFTYSLKISFLLFSTTFLICCLLAPFEAFHLFSRSITTFQQKEGWTLPLISPWLISGLPVFDKTYFTTNTDFWSALSYAIFLPILIIIFIITLQRPKSKYKKIKEVVIQKLWLSSGYINNHKLISITLTFFSGTCAYILVYSFMGNKYQLWKFISFCVLPLSFIFPYFIVRSFIFFNKNNKFYLAYLFAIFIIAFVPFKFYTNLPLLNFGVNFYNVRSSAAFLGAISSIFRTINPNSLILIDLTDQSELFVTIEFFKGNPPSRYLLLNPSFPFKSVNLSNYGNPTLLKNFVIISRLHFESLFNNYNSLSINKTIYFYNNDWIIDHGFVVLYGINQGTEWLLPKDYLTARVGLPKKLIGKPVKLSINFKTSEDSEADSEFCGYSAYFAFQNIGHLNWVMMQPDLIEAVADPSMTKSGILTATVKLVRKETADRLKTCKLTLNSVDVVEFNNDEIIN